MASKEIRQLIGLGGSTVVSLPMTWLDYYDVKPGDKVEVITKNKTAIIKLLDKIEGEEKNGFKNGEPVQD